MAEDLAQMADDLAEMERLAEARLWRQQSIDRSLAKLEEIEQHMKGFDVEIKKVVSEEHFRRYREIADRGDPAALVKFFEDSIRARDARMSQRQAANDSTQHMEK